MTELQSAIESLVKITGSQPDYYICSMDHSPSEQLDKNDSAWTSVIIISPGGEHSELADKVANSLRRNRLSKWKNGGKEYRRRFHAVLANHLKDYPAIILAISANRPSIEDSLNHFAQDLQVISDIKLASKNGKKFIVISNLTDAQTGLDTELRLPWGRGVMCFFIAHFILRMRQELKNGSSRNLDFCFYCDKFAGGTEMGNAINLLLKRNSQDGRITINHFKESDSASSDLLADNIAGCLSGLHGAEDPRIDSWHERIYWERWY